MKLLIELDEEYIKTIDKIKFLVGGRTDRSLQLEIIKAIKNGKALEQEPVIDKVKQAREEIENEVKFWSEPSKYNVDSVVNARKAKVQSYKHCLEIIDKLIAESEG